MGESNMTLEIIAEGWHTYLIYLSSALAPLPRSNWRCEPLRRRAPSRRSRHIIGERAGRFHYILGEGAERVVAYSEVGSS
jgi:hypothetical protein